jgi:hypothetical protein
MTFSIMALSILIKKILSKPYAEYLYAECRCADASDKGVRYHMLLHSERNYENRAEVTENHKYTSLLLYCTNYGRKSFMK